MPTRREFLQSLTAVAVASSSWTAFAKAGFARSPGQPQWRLAPETGCFESLVGPGVIPQMEHAATTGYTAFLDPGLLGRPRGELRAILTAACELGLQLGPAEFSFTLGGSALQQAFERLRAACAGGLAGGRILVGPQQMLAPGATDWTASIRSARRVAEQHQVPLVLEAWDDGRRGARLYDDAAAWVAAVDHPRLRLSFDTVRLTAAGRDVLADAHQWKTLVGHIETDLAGECLLRLLDEFASPADPALACIGYRGPAGGLQPLLPMTGDFLG